jgi:predicted DNA-binding transcriptional regulator AlpA
MSLLLRLIPADPPSAEDLAQRHEEGAPADLAAAIRELIRELRRPAVEPELVDIQGLAQLLSRSEGALHRDDAAGRMPSAVRIGGSKRWRISEIRAWVRAGCPCRKDWNAMRKAAGGGS